ncbi:uncharacterized protein LOC135815648 [Sycon ciliatum]|uniref:uncharacterized protein LOC135815648 n=1 Tax=Sycon ciliatum TaxID=27933 RepID=UPI0020AB55D0|eukprot:scpid62774/ scgid24131/ 
MSGLGGMLGGRLKSAKAITKGRRAKKQQAEEAAEQQVEQQPAQPNDGPAPRLSFKGPSQHGLRESESSAADAAMESPDAGTVPPKKVAVWGSSSKKQAAQKAADSAAEEQRRFRASAEEVEEILDAIPVIREADVPSPGRDEGVAHAPGVTNILDTYRVLDRELIAQQVSWNVGGQDGQDLSVLANAVMLPKAQCQVDWKAEDWNTLMTSVKSDEADALQASGVLTPPEPLSPLLPPPL